MTRTHCTAKCATCEQQQVLSHWCHLILDAHFLFDLTRRSAEPEGHLIAVFERDGG